MLGEILGAVGGIAGGLLNNKANKKAAEQNYNQQKEFAQKSLQWKAADAESAGISKVFAMGAPTASFTPSNVGDNFSFLENAGQNIGRAISATQSPGNQAGAIPRAAQALQLESIQLDNDIKRSQLASLNKTLLQPAQPPGIPAENAPYAIPGQPLTVTPPELSRTTKLDVQGRDPGVVPQATPENMPVRTASGATTMMLAPATQEALESMGFVAQRQAEMRNTVLPWLFDKWRPQSFRQKFLPKGMHARFNPLTGEYTIKKTRPYHNPRGR